MDEEEFRKKLTPEQYRILREKDTERAYSGKYWDQKDAGLYTCAACGQVLFLSLSKLDAGNGWPTFKKPAHGKAVELKNDAGKTEVCCKKCGSHLGYREGEHLRANSGALDFLPMPELELPEFESEEKAPEAKGQVTQMVTFTLGGLAFGTAIGASVVFLSPPAPSCVPEIIREEVQVVVPSTKTVTTTVSEPIIKEATSTEVTEPASVGTTSSDGTGI